MGVIASTGAIEGFYWAQLASFIIFHHQDPFRTAWLWFRCILTISVILSYYGLYFN
jgi:nitrate/nitrite transporter NarK